MQEKSDRLRSFLDRFNNLSVRIGQNTGQTCKTAGISRSLFYEIRDGKRDLTAKMEDRLSYAEKAAELNAASGDIAESLTKVEDLESSSEKKDLVMTENTTPFKTLIREIQQRQETDGLERLIERIALALEKLVEIEERKTHL